MVLKRESVTTRLAELDTVTHELRRYKNITAYELQTDLSQRWVIERGLIARQRSFLTLPAKSSSKNIASIPKLTNKV